MRFLTAGLFAGIFAALAGQKALATNSTTVGPVRIQCLSDNLARLEVRGAEGFEDRPTFHVVQRDWPGTTVTTNAGAGEVVVRTLNYSVHVPTGATSLTGVYLTSATGQTIYAYDGKLNNSVWLPGPAAKPQAWSFADTPRLVPPAGGVTPAPAGAPLAASSGWDTNNDAADVYVFVPGGSYQQLRQDFLKLTGPTPLIPLYALGAWDSRWFDYSEATALAQVDAYRSRQFPLDVLVCDTGWRVNASTGYQPNTNLFPDLPHFFAAAHAKNVRVMFNDHPEPVAAGALDPLEVAYRYTNLTQLLGEGLDVWWYDRNWSISLFSPAANLRHEVWGMRVYHDATAATNTLLRPMIMVNVDGIDNGMRNRPMNVAAHTYPIQWTGDIGPSSLYLKNAVENAVHSGVQALFPYESDDLGGHTSDPTPDSYIRWIEYGALSPIYRPHCTYNLTRMPWTFGAEAEWTARRFVNLRYRLLPVFYAAARENYDTGEPMLRRLDLDYPQYPEASQEDQYLIGHSLLVAPVIGDSGTPVPASWLTTTTGQPGLNAAYYANTNLAGAPDLARIDPNIDFNWNNASPGGTVPAVNFTVRWIGNITIPSAQGDVTLAALSDDGVRVWLNGQLCIDNWGPNDSVTTGATNVLQAGQTYALRVEYLQLGGKDVVALKWRKTGDSRTVWIPPGTWINAWTGATVNGPTTMTTAASLDQIPLFIRSGAIFALAPQMQFTGQSPWDPVTLDVYPSTTETDQTVLYEDDTRTTAYQSGAYRTTTIKTWADESAKTVAVAIAPAAGAFAGDLPERAWVVRWHRPPHWPEDLVPAQVTLNGQPLAPVGRRIKNLTAMPLGAANGAPDADVFEVAISQGSVLTSNLLVATFAPETSPWKCGDIGYTSAQGNAIEGATLASNSVWRVRGGGPGWGGTNDGFHFLYQPCLSNAQLTARLTGQTASGNGAKAGILLGESLDPGARLAALALTADNHLVFQSRASNGVAGQTTVIPGFAAPCWLRLLRQGNSFIAYASPSGALWTQVAAVTIPGFDPHAYIGLAVTAGNSAVNSVDDTNYNEAVFDRLLANSAFSISTVPNQFTAVSTPTPAIPFAVNSPLGNTFIISAHSSDTNLLPEPGIVLAGTGTNRTLTLTPRIGNRGTCTVTLTADDGVNTASTEFSLTVQALSGPALSRVLLNETFSNYPAGNLPAQPCLGAGFMVNAVWQGLDSTFAGNVGDAAKVSFPGLTSAMLDAGGGTATVKGDGSNVEAFPDLSAAGPFAVAGLRDAASGTVGGGSVSGTLYLRFLMRAHFESGANAYGGLQLSRSDDTTGALLGNNAAAWAFSLWAPATSTAADLVNNTGSYLVVDSKVHLWVARIDYHADAADTLTVWMDPDPMAGENGQDSSTTYRGTITGDFSFDRFMLRGGYTGKQFDYGAICMGTSWAAVLPEVVPPGDVPPLVDRVEVSADRYLSLSFRGTAGQSYSILTSSNLAVPPNDWALVGRGTFGFDPISFGYDIPQNEVCRFFQIAVP